MGISWSSAIKEYDSPEKKKKQRFPGFGRTVRSWWNLPRSYAPEVRVLQIVKYSIPAYPQKSFALKNLVSGILSFWLLLWCTVIDPISVGNNCSQKAQKQACRLLAYWSCWNMTAIVDNSRLPHGSSKFMQMCESYRHRIENNPGCKHHLPIIMIEGIVVENHLKPWYYVS